MRAGGRCGRRAEVAARGHRRQGAEAGHDSALRRAPGSGTGADFSFTCVCTMAGCSTWRICGKRPSGQKPTATSYITLLEAAHLIHRLPPFGYGKEILRGRYKVYLADAAIAPSVLLKGKSLLEDATAMGAAVETAFLRTTYLHALLPAKRGLLLLARETGARGRHHRRGGGPVGALRGEVSASNDRLGGLKGDGGVLLSARCSGWAMRLPRSPKILA